MAFVLIVCITLTLVRGYRIALYFIVGFTGLGLALTIFHWLHKEQKFGQTKKKATNSGEDG
jgi:hypothetical protein